MVLIELIDWLQLLRLKIHLRRKRGFLSKYGGSFREREKRNEKKKTTNKRNKKKKKRNHYESILRY